MWPTIPTRSSQTKIIEIHRWKVENQNQYYQDMLAKIMKENWYDKHTAQLAYPQMIDKIENKAIYPKLLISFQKEIWKNITLEEINSDPDSLEWLKLHIIELLTRIIDDINENMYSTTASNIAIKIIEKIDEIILPNRPISYWNLSYIDNLLRLFNNPKQFQQIVDENSWKDEDEIIPALLENSFLKQ